jgi:hypothetical protein
MVTSQRLRTGELAFVASGVPGFGAKRYVIVEGRLKAKSAARSGTCEVGNGRITAVIDPISGSVKSLCWKDGLSPALELVDRARQPGLAHYLYVAGLDPKTAESVSAVKIVAGETGPLVSSLIAESGAPGTRGLVREYRIVDGILRLDVAVTIDKEKVRDKEGVHIAFPFAVPGGSARVDVGWGFVRPEADQIAGACKDFFCARDSVDISNGGMGVTWISLDAPLVEIGAITDETPRQSERREWLKELAPSTLLFSYAMNNYWHTNYKADQEGPVTLRYAVAPHAGSDVAAAKKLGLEAAAPLIPVAAEPASPVPAFPLVVTTATFVATSLRPLADGKGWLLRLLNVSDRPEALILSGPPFERGRVFLSDISGTEGPLVSGPLEAPSFGIVTLLIHKGAATVWSGRPVPI